MAAGATSVVGTLGVGDTTLKELPSFLWEPGMLPCQWYKRSDRSPEVFLWFRVLDDALDIWQRGPQRKVRLQKAYLATQAWFADTSGSDEPGSIVFVCQVLGINLAALRARLASGSAIGPIPRSNESLPTPQLRAPRERA